MQPPHSPILALTLSLALLASHTTAAEKEGPKKPDAFASADKDGDGKLSAPEFTAMMLVEFEAMDKNSDGAITGDELGPDPSPIVVAMDADKDARITRAEFTTAVAGLFKDLDTDEDKGITRGELAVLDAVTKGSGPNRPKPPTKE